MWEFDGAVTPRICGDTPHESVVEAAGTEEAAGTGPEKR